MWGPSEFTATGTLKHFDGTGWLRGLRIPTLFVTGEFDEATPGSTERFAKLVPGAEFAVVPGAAGCGTAADVPLKLTTLSSGPAAVTPSPGAARVTSGPRLEKKM